MKFLITIFLLTIIFSIIYSSEKSAVKHKSKLLKVDSLLRASKQWIAASKKDKDIVNKVIHSSGGISYLNAANALMSHEELLSIDADIEKNTIEANYQFNECVRHLRNVLSETNKNVIV